MSETETIPQPASPDLGSLSSADLKTWRVTGEAPAPKESQTSDVSAASSAAEPDVQAAETAATTSAASEPAPPKKANAETRKAELAAEIQALLKQRDDIKASLSSAARPTAPPDVSTASSPVTQPVSMDSVIEAPDVSTAMLTDEAFFAQFPQASLSDYVRYSASYAVEAHEQRRTQTQNLTARRESYKTRLSAIPPDVLTQLPDALRTAIPTGLLSPGQSPGLWNVVAEELLQAQDTARLVTHLVATPADLERIAATHDPLETIRTIAQIEARLGQTSAPPPPVVKTTTSAPPPPPTLGSKPALPADDVEEALATGDVGKYIRVMNAREMASLR